MMEMISERIVNKAVLLGAKQKTELRQRYFSKDEEYLDFVSGKNAMKALGTSFSIIKRKKNDIELELQIWEISHEIEIELVNRYFKGANYVIYVFDHCEERDLGSIPNLNQINRGQNSMPPNVVILGLNINGGKLSAVIKLKQLIHENLGTKMEDIQYWTTNLETGENIRDCLTYLFNQFDMN